MFVRKWILPCLVALAAIGCRDVPADDDPDGGAGPDARSGADANPGPHPGEVWVMSWNLQTFPKTASTVARVGQLLEASPVDVVGVQEIQDVTAFAALDERLPGYAGLLASNGDGFSRVGLLYRPETVTVGEAETLFLGDGAAFPRPPLAVEVSAQGIDFTVVVLHLKAQGDETSEARRRDAINKLDTWLQAELVAVPERRFLLVGDWNDQLTDGADDNVFQAMLDRPASYEFLTLPLARMSGESTYIPFPSFIDHMMLTDNALPAWGQGSTEVLYLDDEDSQYQSIVSDHRPVLTKFHPAP